MLTNLYALAAPAVNWYVDPYLSALVLAAIAASSWVISMRAVGAGWFQIDPSSIGMSILVFVTGVLALCGMVDGFNHVFIISGLGLFLTINPFYVLTGGMGVQLNTHHTSLKKKHTHYRLWCFLCLGFVAFGSGIHWFNGQGGQWGLLAINLLLLAGIISVEPRQLLVSQQLFYSYKAIRK
jgi:hypothetical protein